MAVACSLCQLAEGPSCGGCCGLYNLKRHDRAALERLLRARTAAFGQAWDESRQGGDLRPLRAFAWQARRAQVPDLALPLVRVCPFVGLLEGRPGRRSIAPQDRTAPDHGAPDHGALDHGALDHGALDHGAETGPGARVGCLLHPALVGRELRFLGVHGSRLCREHRCAAHWWLREDELALLRAARPSWYAYGLLLAEPAYLRCFLAGYARATGRLPRDLHPDALAALAAYLGLLDQARPQPGADADVTPLRSGSMVLAAGRVTPAASWYRPNLAASSPWHDALAVLEVPLDDQVLVSGLARQMEAWLQRCVAAV